MKHLIFWGVFLLLGWVIQFFFHDWLIMAIVGLLVFIPWLLGYVAQCGNSEKSILSIGKLHWDKFVLGHILILGQTRRGKTSSGMSLVINQLSEYYENWGGLVLGVKNTEHNFYLEHFEGTPRENDVVILKVRSSDDLPSWSPPFRFNLTESRAIPFEGYAKIIIDATQSLQGNQGKGDAFWSSTIQLLIREGFTLLDALDKPITIPNLYELLTDVKTLSTALIELKKLPSYEKDEDLKNLLNNMNSMLLASEAVEQREGTMGSIRQYLGFFMQSDIREVFCSETPNVTIEQMDEGKIICTSIPQHFPYERKFIHTMLKQLAYYHGMIRFDKDAENKGYIQERCNRLLFIFDEAQDVITANESGTSDHTILDRIGGAKVTVIFSMQSAESPRSKIGADANSNLINHFSTRLYFQLGNENEAQNASKYIGQSKKKKIRKTYSAGGLALGSASRSVNFEETYDVPAVAFLRLQNHQAIVVHPSKEFDVLELPPLTPKGKIEAWYKPNSGSNGISAVKSLIRKSYQ